MISRCLVQHPEVILLDEPTNHLDIRHRLELMDTLRAFDGMVILTLHELNLAARYCDFIYVMKAGKVTASGLPADVLRPQILNATFDTTLPVVEHGGEIFIGV